MLSKVKSIYFQEQESHDEMDTETEIQTDDQDTDLFKVASRYSGSAGSCGSNRSLRSLGKDTNNEFPNSVQLQSPSRTIRRGNNTQQEASTLVYFTLSYKIKNSFVSLSINYLMRKQRYSKLTSI